MKTNSALRVVEIVGVAGAGKSTLSHALKRMDASIRLCNFPNVRKISDAPFFFWNGLQVSFALRNLEHERSRKLTRREFAWLSILNGWPARLQRELQDRLIVLDQGPLYLMTELSEFGPEFLRSDAAEHFWRRLHSRWAGTLDAIIWLEAADADLLKRIRTRDKEHVVKNKSDQPTLAFLDLYRRAYERVILKLTMTHSDLKIFRLDASRNSAEELAHQVLIETGFD
jgi:deoxyadenosine/deoxycytidine kinase